MPVRSGRRNPRAAPWGPRTARCRVTATSVKNCRPGAVQLGPLLGPAALGLDRLGIGHRGGDLARRPG